MDIVLSKRRKYLISQAFGLLADHPGDTSAYRGQHFSRSHAIVRNARVVKMMFLARHTDHEEFVKVRRKDRKKLQPFEQREARIQAFFENAAEELNQAQVSI
jgi:hypothetical protein